MITRGSISHKILLRAKDWSILMSCSNDFQLKKIQYQPNNGTCQDFEVQFCCPKEATGACDAEGYEWSSWYNVDDPASQGSNI